MLLLRRVAGGPVHQDGGRGRGREPGRAVSGRRAWIGDAGFEIGDAPVLEAQVGPGGLEPFVEGAVVGGELADALLERGVLGGDPLDGLLGPFGFQVPDLAEELADCCPSLKIPMKAALVMPMWGCGKAPQPGWLRGLDGGGAGGRG